MVPDRTETALPGTRIAQFEGFLHEGTSLMEVRVRRKNDNFRIVQEGYMSRKTDVLWLFESGLSVKLWKIKSHKILCNRDALKILNSQLRWES